MRCDDWHGYSSIEGVVSREADGPAQSSSSECCAVESTVRNAGWTRPSGKHKREVPYDHHTAAQTVPLAIPSFLLELGDMKALTSVGHLSTREIPSGGIEENDDYARAPGPQHSVLAGGRTSAAQSLPPVYLHLV
ncbi:hypothetical protein DTO271D3_8947 [Paecilomyces variotii]|nr:hypothetical protein DTO271D3_8947 [Paecilomyces variotii]